MKSHTDVIVALLLAFSINALTFEEFVDTFSFETFKRERGQPTLHESHHSLMATKGTQQLKIHYLTIRLHRQ
jgi:hypothetical protein